MILLILLGLLLIMLIRKENIISLDIYIKNSMHKLSSENQSVIVITFEGLEKYLAIMKSKESKDKVLALNGDGKNKLLF